ncbi:hypothetical protein NT05HA_1283 [Aggregatibacter aphrophilus NJ8700]|nr:hypothetical protein NT05HA_1283 [Aggregatibacter aphrophilus NJ8700]
MQLRSLLILIGCILTSSIKILSKESIMRKTLLILTAL